MYASIQTDPLSRRPQEPYPPDRELVSGTPEQIDEAVTTRWPNGYWWDGTYWVVSPDSDPAPVARVNVYVAPGRDRELGVRQLDPPDIDLAELAEEAHDGP